MAIESALKFEIVEMASPIAPKLDLVMGQDGLEVSRDFEELLQELLIQVLRQRGDYRYNRRAGLPWITNPYHRVIPIYGSLSDPSELQRVENLVLRELYRHPRVKQVISVSARHEDMARRRIRIEAKVVTFDERLVELVV